MTNEAFQRMAQELKAGNNQTLDTVFKKHYGYCVAWLQQKYQCEQPDAEDIFMDALLVFRAEVIKERVSNRNIRGYLITVAKNIYLSRMRQQKVISVDAVEFSFGREDGLYDEEFNPLLKAEAAAELNEQQRQQQAAYREAWKKLGEPCKKLLKGFYIDKIKLKDLQGELGYKTYDTIKSMRRRCFNQLRDWAAKLMEYGH